MLQRKKLRKKVKMVTKLSSARLPSLETESLEKRSRDLEFWDVRLALVSEAPLLSSGFDVDILLFLFLTNEIAGKVIFKRTKYKLVYKLKLSTS
jgi:hypothetical protein